MAAFMTPRAWACRQLSPTRHSRVATHAEIPARSSCEAMREILLRQEFNDEIPAGVPPGTRVAHKTGWITGVHHDAAIVFPRDRAPYVLVVLTRGMEDDAVARSMIADVSRLAYAYAATQSRPAPVGP
jgi:beta-lactamase class A